LPTGLRRKGCGNHLAPRRATHLLQCIAHRTAERMTVDATRAPGWHVI
jgi:hypothetical protein